MVSVLLILAIDHASFVAKRRGVVAAIVSDDSYGGFSAVDCAGVRL
jgi:hypothetical protein